MTNFMKMGLAAVLACALPNAFATTYTLKQHIEGLVAAPTQFGCAALLAENPGTPTGFYLVTLPDGSQATLKCDMTTNGGGWTLVARGTATDIAGWYTDSALAVATKGAATSGTFHLSASNMNGLRKEAWRTVVTQGYLSTRYWKPSCDYSFVTGKTSANSACYTSYATLNWTSAHPGTAAAIGSRSGLCDFDGTGYFIETVAGPGDGWSAGNGSDWHASGTGTRGTLESIEIWAR